MADQGNHQHADGIDRRGFLKCMAWVGTGLVWTFSGGVLAGCATVSSTNTLGGTSALRRSAIVTLQLAWLQKDVVGLSSSTPIVVFAHIPLWTVYPQWGWGTDDSAQALGYLRRFGSLTVLNGHIHQILQKVEET